MSITTQIDKPARVYVTAVDPVTKRSKSQVFYNTTPEQFIGAAREKLAGESRRPHTRKVG